MALGDLAKFVYENGDETVDKISFGFMKAH
jgi:hypothetical protein